MDAKESVIPLMEMFIGCKMRLSVRSFAVTGAILQVAFVLPVLAYGLAGCASVQKVPPMEGVPPSAPVQTVEVTAQKYRFTPSEIRVKQGTVVRITFRSLDTEHGFKIARYGIDVDIPKKGRGTATVAFYARKAGTYEFHCSNFCGLGHWGMDGKVIVEE